MWDTDVSLKEKQSAFPIQEKADAMEPMLFD
jgi:hypothetical protein